MNAKDVARDAHKSAVCIVCNAPATMDSPADLCDDDWEKWFDYQIEVSEDRKRWWKLPHWMRPQEDRPTSWQKFWTVLGLSIISWILLIGIWVGLIWLVHRATH